MEIQMAGCVAGIEICAMIIVEMIGGQAGPVAVSTDRIILMQPRRDEGCSILVEGLPWTVESSEACGKIALTMAANSEF
jgi:hypothetical protein